jgi:hypothetical protein
VPLSWQGCWSVAACRSASEKVDHSKKAMTVGKANAILTQ